MFFQVEVPCEKLVGYQIAEHVEFKKEGGLTKLIKSPWQKRYCVVHNGIMYMYESPKGWWNLWPHKFCLPPVAPHKRGRFDDDVTGLFHPDRPTEKVKDRRQKSCRDANVSFYGAQTFSKRGANIYPVGYAIDTLLSDEGLWAVTLKSNPSGEENCDQTVGNEG